MSVDVRRCEDEARTRSSSESGEVTSAACLSTSRCQEVRRGGDSSPEACRPHAWAAERTWSGAPVHALTVPKKEKKETCVRNEEFICKHKEKRGNPKGRSTVTTRTERGADEREAIQLSHRDGCGVVSVPSEPLPQIPRGQPVVDVAAHHGTHKKLACEYL